MKCWLCNCPAPSIKGRGKRDLTALQDKFHEIYSQLAVFRIRLTTSIEHRATTAVGMLLDPSLSTIRPVNLFCKLTKGHFQSSSRSTCRISGQFRITVLEDRNLYKYGKNRILGGSATIISLHVYSRLGLYSY